MRSKKRLYLCVSYLTVVLVVRDSVNYLKGKNGLKSEKNQKVFCRFFLYMKVKLGVGSLA